MDKRSLRFEAILSELTQVVTCHCVMPNRDSRKRRLTLDGRYKYKHKNKKNCLQNLLQKYFIMDRKNIS